MPDTIFHPGDKVCCVKPGPTSLVGGAIYTITIARSHGVLVAGHLAWYDVARFRKVEEVALEISQDFP